MTATSVILLLECRWSGMFGIVAILHTVALGSDDRANLLCLLTQKLGIGSSKLDSYFVDQCLDYYLNCFSSTLKRLSEVLKGCEDVYLSTSAGYSSFSLISFVFFFLLDSEEKKKKCCQFPLLGIFRSNKYGGERARFVVRADDEHLKKSCFFSIQLFSTISVNNFDNLRYSNENIKAIINRASERKEPEKGKSSILLS